MRDEILSKAPVIFFYTDIPTCLNKSHAIVRFESLRVFGNVNINNNTNCEYKIKTKKTIKVHIRNITKHPNTTTTTRTIEANKYGVLLL